MILSLCSRIRTRCCREKAIASAIAGHGSRSSKRFVSAQSSPSLDGTIYDTNNQDLHCKNEEFTITTTTVAPKIWHGPFGSGGTVVGYSKYDGVRYAFEENFAERLELGAQLVVYEKGEKVVDLYGYAPETAAETGAEGGGYDGDTLQCIWSSGKNLEAIAMAMLVDRGLVSYDDRVADHWPEFGTNGKHDVTVADVMRHSGGVPFVVDPNSTNYPRDTLFFGPETISDVEVLEDMLGSAEKYPPPGTGPSPAFYHAMSRGWLVNGILRRADPKGRSIGRFVREEITDPLGVTLFCGMSRDEQDQYRYADFMLGSTLYNGLVRLLPAACGYKDGEIAEFAKVFLHEDFPKVDSGPVQLRTLPPDVGLFNTAEGRALEVSSANMVGNARALAKITAAMAGDGSSDGVRLMREEAVREAMEDVKVDVYCMLEAAFGFSRGGFCSFKHTFGADIDPHHKRFFAPEDREAYGNFEGWGGLGGSMSLWDREKDVSFAYCMTAAGLDMIGGKRTRRILLELQTAME